MILFFSAFVLFLLLCCYLGQILRTGNRRSIHGNGSRKWGLPVGLGVCMAGGGGGGGERVEAEWRGRGERGRAISDLTCHY